MIFHQGMANFTNNQLIKNIAHEIWTFHLKYTSYTKKHNFNQWKLSSEKVHAVFSTNKNLITNIIMIINMPYLSNPPHKYTWLYGSNY